VSAARLAYALQRASAGASETDRLTEISERARPRGRDRPLRRAWLESLARRAEWAQLLDHYDAASASETLACAQLNARIALEQTSGLEAAIAERWLAPYRLAGVRAGLSVVARPRRIDDALVAERARRLLAMARRVSRASSRSDCPARRPRRSSGGPT